MKYAHANTVPTKEVGEPLTYQLAAAGLAKHQPRLLDAVNKGLESMLADGTVERLSKEFVGKDYDMVGSIAKAKAEVAATSGK
jgi:cystine transport system substrate-binding protein